MTPPNVYPEGIPFYDARPPQDAPDRLQDDSYLTPTGGGMAVTTGTVPGVPPGTGYQDPSGQTIPIGARSPQDLLPTPQPPPSPTVLQDDRTFITGPIPAPESPGTPPNLKAI